MRLPRPMPPRLPTPWGRQASWPGAAASDTVPGGGRARGGVLPGTMTSRGVPPAGKTADPCDPLGGAVSLLPDGLFRVEVLDAGSASDAATATFAWSFDNGASAVPV